MDKHIQLSITSPTTEVTVSSVDADEVARIVKLAGIQKPSATPAVLPTAALPPVPTPAEFPSVPTIEPAADVPMSSGMDSMAHDSSYPPTDADTDMAHSMDDTSAEDMVLDNMEDLYNFDASSDEDTLLPEPSMHADANGMTDAEEPSYSAFHESQAAFDYGIEEEDDAQDDTGVEVPVNNYMWQAERLPQRFKGSPGDSGLLEDIHKNLISRYKNYLKESSKRENEAGNMSPLSDPTKPEFDKDPLSDETPVDDGSRSPMSTVVRQSFYK
jgi:hypothetical protein